MMSAKKQLLCYGIGNISRGDDGLGPALLHWLSKHNSSDEFEIQLEPAFQLQPENLYEFADKDVVLFLDADARFSEGVHFAEVFAKQSNNPFVSHALPPEQLLALYNELMDKPHPPAFCLSMGTHHIGLQETLSETAIKNLEGAKPLLKQLINLPLTQWRPLTSLSAPSAQVSFSGTHQETALPNA